MANIVNILVYCTNICMVLKFSFNMSHPNLGQAGSIVGTNCLKTKFRLQFTAILNIQIPSLCYSSSFLLLHSPKPFGLPVLVGNKNIPFIISIF